MIESPSLFVLDPRLTLLSSACTSFMPNQVYSLAHVYHRPISWRFHKRLPFALVEFVYRWLRASAQHGVSPLRAMASWSHSCLHVSVLFGHPREYRLRSHRWSILFGSSYPDGGLLPLTLGYEKVLFHSEHPLKLLDQEDRVMKSDTSRVMKHNLILPGDMSPTHERKSCMGDWKVFFLPSLPISSFLHDRCILCRFLCSPAFINLGMRFL
jgi:hypothetical protein